MYPTAIKRKNKLILLLRNYWADMFWLFSIFKRYRNVNTLFDLAISPPWGTMSEKRIRKFVFSLFPRSQICWMRHLKNISDQLHTKYSFWKFLSLLIFNLCHLITGTNSKVLWIVVKSDSLIFFLPASSSFYT